MNRPHPCWSRGRSEQEEHNSAVSMRSGTPSPPTAVSQAVNQRREEKS
jgi:hypothetical protein